MDSVMVSIVAGLALVLLLAEIVAVLFHAVWEYIGG